VSADELPGLKKPFLEERLLRESERDRGETFSDADEEDGKTGLAECLLPNEAIALYTRHLSVHRPSFLFVLPLFLA